MEGSEEGQGSRRCVNYDAVEAVGGNDFKVQDKLM